MTNYNERLDEALLHLQRTASELSIAKGLTYKQVSQRRKYQRTRAKQAITSLTKELVDEQIVQALKELKEEVIGEVPSKMNTDNWKYDKRVAELKLWQHQAIDNKIKELVAEAKPKYQAFTRDMVSRGEVKQTIDEFEQNLLKALEEV